MVLPEAGSVLGIDVGCSPQRRSSAVCRLDWAPSTFSFFIARFRAAEPERSEALRGVADRPVLAAAFDGPLRAGLDVINKYRLAEQILTRRLHRFIGKPGQSNTPVGRLLNTHANECARAVLATGSIGPASHDHAIHLQAIIEAFPGAFMGVLIHDPVRLAAVRRNRSDVFYQELAETGGFTALTQRMLPGYQPEKPFGVVANHDERASIACALTALCVVARDYTAVGDRRDGWILLPPRSLIQPWAWTLLHENAADGGLEYRDPGSG